MRRAATLLFLCLLAGCAGRPEPPSLPAWRGVMVDTSRHFPELDELLDLLPKMQAAGFNVLHLHLTDGPGWRFESAAYPQLVRRGAWRVDKTDSPWNWRETQFWDDAFAEQGLKRYGGFYSRDDLARLNIAAREYGITLVPEIDLPGHAAALLTACPELACPTNRDPAGWFRGRDVLCVGNPETLRFAETLVGELCDAFPDAPIHIGGDEVPETVWDECPLCHAPETRRAFWRSLVESVRRHGRDVLAWDDLRQADIDLSGVTLLCWHDDATPRPQDIACPYSFCYLDQAASRARLPSWNIPRNIRGVQLNLWTEEMPTSAIRARILDEGLHALRTALAAPFDAGGCL